MTAPLAKVQPQSLVDVVAERIEQAIIAGRLETGARLSEQGLAASLGVSRGPLREAIRRLEGRGLLERTPNIGVRVAALSLKDLNELLQVREVLEGQAAALAATAMSDADIAALGKLIEAHARQKSVQQGEGYYQESKDEDFHVRIVTGSGNARLAQMLTGDLYYLLRVYRYRSSTNPGRARHALDEHRAIVAAIAARDPQRAEARMREHLRNARRYVEEQLERESGDAPAAPSGRRASL